MTNLTKEGVTKTVHKYLLSHAEVGTKQLSETHLEPVQNVLVIPARAEGDNIVATLNSIPADRKVLCIIVINGTKGDSQMETRNRETQNAIQRLAGSPPCNKKRIEKTNKTPPETTKVRRKNHLFLVIDRFSEHRAFSTKQGVGCARKLGADLALLFRAKKLIASSYIHFTDADVLLPIDYFLASDRFEKGGRTSKRRTAGLVYPFLHTPHVTSEARAVYEYDAHLRNYVLGLRFAKSPFAYHSIGSTMAINAESYAAVRGVPKRKAGEDFHLLRKLAKVGSIRKPRSKPIELSGRISNRVPFGTGPSVRDAADKTRMSYHPKAFEVLRRSLSFTCSGQHQIERWHAEIEGKPEAQVLEQTGYFRALSFAKSFHTARANSQVRFYEKFDALCTLRTVRGLTDLYEPIPSAAAFEFWKQRHPDLLQDDDRKALLRTGG